MARVGWIALALALAACGGKMDDGASGTTAQSSGRSEQCPASLDDYCAHAGCVRAWSEASDGARWCSSSGQLAYISEDTCGGMSVVTFSPTKEDAFAYYYDAASGALVGVERAADLASECVAGAPGYVKPNGCNWTLRELCDTW
jgi:hypothetical protein